MRHLLFQKSCKVVFTKDYTIYKKATDNTSSVEVTKSTASGNVARVVTDNTEKRVKVYVTSGDVSESDLASTSGDVVLSDDKKKVYVLASNGTYTEYTLQTLIDISTGDSSNSISLSASEQSSLKVEIDNTNRIITYHKDKVNENDVLKESNLSGNDEVTIQLVSGSGVTVGSDVEKVGEVLVEKENIYAIYTVNYVVASDLGYDAFTFTAPEVTSVGAIKVEKESNNDVVVFYNTGDKDSFDIEKEGLTVDVTSDNVTAGEEKITWVKGTGGNTKVQLKVTYKAGDTEYEKTLDYKVVDVPKAETLGADFADNLSDKIEYKEKKDGIFKILTTGVSVVTAGAFKCGTVSSDTIAANEDHITATYSESGGKGTLTVGYYVTGDVEDGKPKDNVTPIVSQKFDLEVITKAASTENEENVSLVAAQNNDVVSEAAIKADVVVVTLAAVTGGEASTKKTIKDITADCFIAEGYDVYVKVNETRDSAVLYIVSTKNGAKTYTEYSIVEASEYSDETDTGENTDSENGDKNGNTAG